ncbi:hypothetical protein HC928_23615, partial [bacterium]|nr:hypothetical protein [bacterium]
NYSGSGTAQPGATFGAIDTRPSTSETVRLFVNGVQQDVKATKNPADCVGSVEVTKQVDWNGFPVPATAPDFEICLTGVDASQNEVYNACHTVAAGESATFSGLEVDGITYSVSEPNIPANFTASGLGHVTVNKGQTAQVTVTNTHAEFSRLRLTSDCPAGVFRVTNNNAYPVDYTWNTASGNYSGSGTAQPGATFGAIDTRPSTSETVRLFVNGVQQDVKATKPVEQCTGSVEVEKVVDWNGAEVDEEAVFEICLTGADYDHCQTVGYEGGTLTFSGLEPGQYTVSETNPGDEWHVTISGSPATVAAGQTAHVTVTNTHDAPPPPTGSIHVTKEVHWNGVTPDDSQFTLCVDSDVIEAPLCQTVGAGETASFTDLPLGTYNVYEHNPGPLWIASGGGHVTISAEHLSASSTITNARVTLHPLTLTPICPAGQITVTNPNNTDVPFHYNNASYVAPANGSTTITAHPGQHISISFAGGSASTTALTLAECTEGEVTPEPTLGCPANYTLVGEFRDVLGLPQYHRLGVLQRDYGFNLDEGEYNIAIVAASGVGHPERGCLAGGGNDAGAPCDQGQMHEAFNIAINGGNVAFIQDHGEDQWQSFGTVYTGQISGGSNTVSFIHVGTGTTPESVTFKALVCVQPVEEEGEGEGEPEPEVIEPQVITPEVTAPEVTPEVTEETEETEETQETEETEETEDTEDTEDTEETEDPQ